MSQQQYTTQHKRSIYEGFMKLDLYDATVTRGDERVEITREVHDHGNGACVLPYDPARKTALLVRQFRMPVHVAGESGLVLEAAAGVIDPEDENPASAARREAHEELGYDVHDLIHVSTFYPIPGMVTEQMSCFLARYTLADKVEGDTGADEDEIIDVEEWPLGDLWRAFQAGELRDGKAIVCLMALRIAEPALFD
ncbi:NUDIX hydrolase [Acuticoccus sp. MNP-M23]|uniref:NUDIX hydrolase n=1 Tax=Acuticoccus sp. MNP-M23 TaxID=3072793 RepID=UPI002815F3E6|nr:NUDIX hydrolase [Acuticoccus sp. MNP-M23]WMS44108.1 NUDIX hydrolase [Acuticoccus sp. MNP-M23]